MCHGPSSLVGINPLSRNLLPKTTRLGPIRLEPPMKMQTLLKVQELVPSNVLSVWAMVTLLQIAQQKGT